MKEFQSKVEKISLIVTLIASVIIWIFFGFNAFLGIWIGCMCALIGFRMIIKMAKNLNPDENKAKKQGITSYTFRYLFYGVVLAVSAFRGIPILSVLAGIMCHKASLLIYTAIEKEDA
ncbi:ATP synthase subunit I [Floccifex sp.]|uniref:ATP synthase subunit I n=1 Tax=Floccifex sp. TaxID=2815810 RepID=UPI003F09724B